MKTAALVAAFALAQPDTSPSLETLLDRLSTYLLDYEKAISEVIADEEMTQTARSTSTRTEGRRRLLSEVAFMRLPGDGAWIGYRLVHHVNGRVVSTESNRLQVLLNGTDDDRARGVAIARESARHNLGLARTTNMPLLALELVHPRHRARFTFSKAGMTRSGGRSLRRIDFVERASPTVIQTGSGFDLPSRGSVWIEESTGRVFQSEVRDRDIISSTRLSVTFVAARGSWHARPRPDARGLRHRQRPWRRHCALLQLPPLLDLGAHRPAVIGPHRSSSSVELARFGIPASNQLVTGGRNHVTADCAGSLRR